MNTNDVATPPDRSRSFNIPICWALLISFDVSLMALTYAREDDVQSDDPPVQQVQTEISGPHDIARNTTRFEAIDVFVDSGKQHLAAWQLELRCTANDVQIVGIEGGEHSAFKEPPYYDSRAMNNNRVIIAAFSTSDSLPSGRSRVARIHVQVRGPGARTWVSELMTSATADGTRIPAAISIQKAND